MVLQLWLPDVPVAPLNFLHDVIEDGVLAGSDVKIKNKSHRFLCLAFRKNHCFLL